MLSDFFDTDISFDLYKDEFLNHMNTLQHMSNEEYTLYKKYQEVTQEYHTWYNKSVSAYPKIWTPSDIQDYNLTVDEIQSLNPRLHIITKDQKDNIDLWTTLRVFTSSFKYERNPGRFLRAFLLSGDNRILGITSIASDLMNLGLRDTYIGWTREQKESGMLNHIAIASTIVPTQPFGYNFLGGKLLASLLTTDVIRDAWKKEYNDVLVGITTTSLYGNGSMYNSIPWWKSLGESNGTATLHPDEQYYKKMRKYLIEKYPDLMDSLAHTIGDRPATAVKTRIIHLIYKECGVTLTKYRHGFKRGMYFAPLYANFKEFLTKNIGADSLTELAKPPTYNNVMDWWTPKAIKRYTKLYNENMLKPDTLYYNTLQFDSWDEVKNNYLPDVGR